MNLSKTWDYLKQHPAYIVGVFGLFFVLWYFLSSGSSSASAATSQSTGPDDAVQIAQLQAQTASQQISASLQGNSDNISGQISLANIGAQVSNYQTEQQANVAELGINSQTQIQLAGIASQVQMASISAYTQQQQIKAVENITLAPYQLQETELNDLTQPLSNGPGGGQHTVLGSLLGGAEGTKNAYINFGDLGISAGRNTPASGFSASSLSGVAGLGTALIGLL